MHTASDAIEVVAAQLAGGQDVAAMRSGEDDEHAHRR